MGIISGPDYQRPDKRTSTVLTLNRNNVELKSSRPSVVATMYNGELRSTHHFSVLFWFVLRSFRLMAAFELCRLTDFLGN